MTKFGVAFAILLVLIANLASCNAQESSSPVHEQEDPTSNQSVPHDLETDFEVKAPDDWGVAPLTGRMKWHFASDNGTTLPDCLVVVTEDPSFQILSNDAYIEGQTEEQFVRLASLNMDDVEIGNWETNFELGGQRALHFIYSATVGEIRQISFSIQTTRSGKLYTFACNSFADNFPLDYADLLKIADSFSFVNNQM